MSLFGNMQALTIVLLLPLQSGMNFKQSLKMTNIKCPSLGVI